MGDEITDNEAKHIIAAIRSLKLKPKADTPEEFKNWLQGMAEADLPIATRDFKSENVSTTMQTKYTGFPRISPFTGSSKRETSYELWRYEIQCLVSEKVYSDDQILQAIRRSVKGEAANVLMRLGSSASIDTILQNMNFIYDTIDSGQMNVEQFYSAEQEDNENVSQWGCRLEYLINKAVIRGEVDKSQMEEMLRHAFWKGLRPSLKDVSGYIYDKHITFSELRAKLRSIEQDQDRRKKGTDKGKKNSACEGHVGMSATHDEESKSGIEEIREMLHMLTAEVQQLKDDRQSRPQEPNRRKTFNRNYQENFTAQDHQPNTEMNHQSRRPPRTMFDQRRDQWSYRGLRRGYNTQGHGAVGQNGPPICYNCGQEGHIQAGCRVKIDNSLKRHLNSKGQVSTGRPLASTLQVKVSEI